MDIKSMYIEELNEWMKEKGQPAFRGGQVYEWMHKKRAPSPSDMTNLPKE